eukprot:CAMPEP_0119121378 /NCGR_PEP_ID=MMETSP1310-20130426/2037_1 /TAXON_ID=464262 /ORGANISM="Genus nov. species nov., Strain RCC2339" /LENGTH=66 /DNA_ID=CAMNT_0007110941 /DNA_START=73 /DNA_END=273 /DNA_ORIENTATION=-
MPARGASQKQRARKLSNKEFAGNIHKRGTNPVAVKKDEGPAVGPVVLGFILFVVVGSAILQIIRGY